MRVMLEAMPNRKLERIILNKLEFNKVDFDDKEIEFHGKMYDIVKIEKHSDQYILFAVHDESEDHLLSLLDEIVKRSGNDKKPVPSQLLQFFSLVFITPLINFELSQDQSKLISLDYPNLYCSIQYPIDSPPPQG